MQIWNKIKANKALLLLIIIFAIISIITLYSIQLSFATFSISLVYRQIIWYLIGFFCIYLIFYYNNDFFFKYAWHLYLIGNVALLGLLLFTEPINNTLRWYSIPYIGTIQPSEFMKIILILVLAKMIYQFNDQLTKPNRKEEFFFLIKVAIIVAIPSFLTLLQPDTGLVIIYLIITIVMLFIGSIRASWFISFLIFFAIIISTIIALYFLNTDLFINLLGTDFFLRIDRLLDWQNKTGFQLEQGIIAIGSGNFFGTGIGNTSIYIPEPHTDFIFAVIANNFGFIGSTLILIIFALFIFFIVKIALNTTNPLYQYLIAGFVAMLFYQQIQNIAMTFGLLPLTGITLPFISAGGSSLISYMILIGIIFNINQTKKTEF